MKIVRTIRNVLFLSLILGLSIPLSYASDEVTYTYNLTYTFENKGPEIVTLTDEDITLPLFTNNTWQNVTVSSSTASYTKQTIDLDDNQGIVMDVLTIIPPYESISYSVEYHITSRKKIKPSFNLSDAQNLDSIPSTLVSDYTGSTETFTMNNEDIVEAAQTIAAEHESVLEVVSGLLGYITTNTTYCNFEVPRYPLETLEENLGDCDDQSILLITMCRSLGIPAYLKVGIIINPNIQDTGTSWDGHLKNQADGLGWHGWASIYIPPWGWVPIDLTLVQEEKGIDYIRNAPQYEPYLIETLNVSEQAYIGNVIDARNRVINSNLYVTIEDSAQQIYHSGGENENLTILVIGLALAVSIFMMFRTLEPGE